MTDNNKIVENRRKLLKSVAAGGGAILAGRTLPEKWGRPVVDSVLLPAHAQASGGPYGGTNNNSLTMNDSDSLFARVVNKLVPEGHAQTSYDFTYCITPVSDTKANTAVLVTPGGDGCSFFAQIFTLDGVEINTGPQVMGLQDLCSSVSATDWFDSIGLIKDAMASVTTTIELTNVLGQATGTVNYDGGFIVDNFTFGGPCPGMTVTCCDN